MSPTPAHRPARAPIIGVVADDITGSNDIGIMFRLSGYRSCVYPAAQPAENDHAWIDFSAVDACILNTNSRLDPPQVAYDKVFQATRRLQSAGCTRFFNKTCSVFRGNIGVEFDAMLDALGLEFAVIVLGYPKNGRTTINGSHYVHGKPLADSEFRSDPIHPMTRSNLVEILQSQTRRKVDFIPGRVLDLGAEQARAEMEHKKQSCSYLIFDVRCQEDLALIAEVVKDEPVLCGSSALAEHLPKVWNVPAIGTSLPSISASHGSGVLCLSGSLMPQTAAQVDYLAKNGTVVFELEAARVLDNAGLQSSVDYWSPRICAELAAGQDVVFHAGNDGGTVAAVRSAGSQLGLDVTQTARRVSSALAAIGAQALQMAGQNRLVVAGGETSDAVCERLGITGLMMWKEIEPGLPSCVTLSNPPLLLVLKSGSFGTPSFLARAIDHLKQEPTPALQTHPENDAPFDTPSSDRE